MPSASGAPSCRPLDVPRRSYLQRIAEPLAGGAPALFAAPRALPEDSRPPASATAQTLRRVSAGGLQARASAAASSSPETSNDVASPTTGASVQVASPKLERGVEPEPTFPSAPLPRPALAAVEPAPAAAPAEPGSVGSVDLGALAAPAAPYPTSVFETEATPAAWGFERDGAARSELGVTPPSGPAFDPPRPEGPAGRIHIGAVEIRTAPPPAAAAPPPVAPSAAPSHVLGGPSTPFSRGYSWRYGLIQS
jgi:hypothetical protein